MKWQVACVMFLILMCGGFCTNCVHQIASDNEMAEVLKANKQSNDTILVMFYAPSWCKYSKRMHPILEKIALEFTQIQVSKIDAYEHDKLNLKFSVFGFPSLFLIKDAEPILRYQGDQTFEDIKKWITTAFSRNNPNDTITNITNFTSTNTTQNHTLSSHLDTLTYNAKSNINEIFQLHMNHLLITENVTDQNVIEEEDNNTPIDYYLYFSGAYVCFIGALYVFRLYHRILGCIQYCRNALTPQPHAHVD